MSTEEVLCSRCKSEPSVLVARKENFCAKCFIKFLRGKQRKQMLAEKYKVKYGQKESVVTKVLLCLSFGLSSLALLDMILSSFQEQAEMHRGRQGYHLTCLTVSDKSESAAIQERTRALIRDYNLQDLKVEFRVLDIESYIPSNESLQKLTIYKDFTTLEDKINDTQLAQKLSVHDLLSLCPARTTKEDLLDIIHHDLYFQVAHEGKFDTVLLGHSMTKLADDVISLTVKGRGAMINERLTDGVLDGTSLEVIHPLRDVLLTEIDKYAEMTQVGQYKLEEPDKNVSRMTKYKTVNELTRQYFDNLDKDYSEVISTVVKIGSKLAQPKKHDSNSDGVTNHCRICGSAIYADPKSWLTKITVKDAAPLNTEEEAAVYKFYRENADASLEGARDGSQVDLCYGCVVTLGEAKELVWPQRDSDILQEYILTDNEE